MQGPRGLGEVQEVPLMHDHKATIFYPFIERCICGATRIVTDQDGRWRDS